MTTSWRGWAESMVLRAAETMKSLRVGQARTAANIASRTRVGKPLTRAVISDLETGRKKTLDISELLTLAAALDVSPLRLLLPNVLEQVEILPGRTVNGTEALAWFLGINDAGFAEPITMLNQGDELIYLAIRLTEVESLLRIQRHNYAHHTHGLKLALSGSLSMSDGLIELERENVRHAEERIALLEAEKQRLAHSYQRLIEEGESE